MTIEIKYTDGTGNNASYDVIQNGKVVARISRNGNYGMTITSIHYGEVLAYASSAAVAREKAETLTYPSREEVYDKICERIYQKRKTVIELYFAQRVARLARQTLDGSNAARAELDDLLKEMEFVARDRLMTSIDRVSDLHPYERRERVAGETMSGLDNYPVPPQWRGYGYDYWRIIKEEGREPMVEESTT